MGTNVLLVEDSPGDVRLTQEAFRAANSDIRIDVVVDGIEALAFLAKEGAYSDAPRPDLILLVLNLPKMDGREALKHIRSDDSLKSIPIVILTTSDAAIDINLSYTLHANSYLSKPVRLEEFDSVVRSINDFWFEKAKLPQDM